MADELVMAVDDNPTNLKLMRVLLQAEGYAVLTATSAESALELIAASPPRLILVDLQMPGIGGLELTRRLKADPLTRSMVVIAVTANAFKGDAERAREAGCDDYVAKPIDTRQIGGLIARHLRRTLP